MKMALLVAIWLVALGAAFWCFLRGGRAGGGCGSCRGCGSGGCDPRDPSDSGEPLRVEILETKNTGPCGDCGMPGRTVTGSLWQNDIKIAFFFAYWTLGRSRHPANFDLVLGDVGDGADPKGRIGISLAFRKDEHGLEFMVIDAMGRPFDSPELLGKALPRNEVVGTPLAREAFDLADCIFANIPQLQEIETEA